MTVKAVSEVRDAVRDALVAAGFLEARSSTFDTFPRDPSRFAHRCFAVGTPSSSFEAFDSRENFGTAGEATTAIGVRLAFRLRADRLGEDYNDALDSEHLALYAVWGMTATGFDFRVDGVPSRRTTLEGDWLISEIRITVFHRFAFAVS